MSDTLLQIIRLLEQRAQYLEQEAQVASRMAQVTDELAAASPVVARYIIEGETYEITQAKVEVVRAKMIKPRSERTLHILILAEKTAQRLQDLSAEEKHLRLEKAIEASRTIESNDVPDKN